MPCSHPGRRVLEDAMVGTLQALGLELVQQRLPLGDVKDVAVANRGTESLGPIDQLCVRLQEGCAGPCSFRQVFREVSEGAGPVVQHPLAQRGLRKALQSGDRGAPQPRQGRINGLREDGLSQLDKVLVVGEQQPEL